MLLVQHTKSILLALILPALCTYSLSAQTDSIQHKSDYLTYAISLQGVVSSGSFASFWIQSNQYGTISAKPYSGNLVLELEKSINQNIYKNKERITNWYDYGFGLKMIGQIDNKIHFLPQEYYLTGRLWLFDLTIGCKEEVWGNQQEDYIANHGVFERYDSSDEIHLQANSLSTGGFLFSPNARPMPRVTLGISRYQSFPFTYGYLEVKGGITQAWYTDNSYISKVMLHHKFAGARIGGLLPVNMSYEFHHVAQWGGYSPIYGNLGNSLPDFFKIFFVRSGGTMANDQLNALGNHIGSQQIALDINLVTCRIHTYWQQLFEDGPIKAPWNAMNNFDGLWGISISQTHWPFISKLVVEYQNTTDQSGPTHDIDGIVLGGADNYFTNSIYRNGWNYYQRTIGTPFISSPIYNSDGSIVTQNNRVQTFHLGTMGDIYDYQYRLLVSYSRNFGTYNSPWLNIPTNTAVMLDVHKHLQRLWNLDFSATFGADFGEQFGNQLGFLFTIKKTGLLTSMRHKKNIK